MVVITKLYVSLSLLTFGTQVSCLPLLECHLSLFCYSGLKHSAAAIYLYVSSGVRKSQFATTATTPPLHA